MLCAKSLYGSLKRRMSRLNESAMRNPSDIKALARLKTPGDQSQNTPATPLEDKIVALVKALAQQAAEEDHRAERERTNG